MVRLYLLTTCLILAIPASLLANPDSTPTSAGATAAPADVGAAQAPPEAEPTGKAQTPAEKMFSTKCASCHTVGKGGRVGPDLKGVVDRRDEDWVKRFITSPSSMLDTDRTARNLLKEWKGVRMPDLGLSDKDASTMVKLLIRCSTQTCNLEREFRASTKATPEEITLGHDLFLGNVSLKNGGPPCISCHNVRNISGWMGGGLLAADLTNVISKLGDQGLDAALANPPFPLMNKIYVEDMHPITSEEAFALRSFLYQSNKTTGSESESFAVPLVATLLAMLSLIILNLFWARRLRGVRTTIAPSQTRGEAHN